MPLSYRAINKQQVKHKMGCLSTKGQNLCYSSMDEESRFLPLVNDIVSSSHTSLNISSGLLIAMLIYKERAKYSTIFHNEGTLVTARYPDSSIYIQTDT